MCRLRRAGIGWMVALAITGCATAPKSDLSGTWHLSMPSGFQHKVRITGEGNQRYRVSKAGIIINGLYEVRGNQLVMVAPADTQLTNFVWKIDNGNHLTLVKEPDVKVTGGKYKTSTLKRDDLFAPPAQPVIPPSSPPVSP